MNSFSEVKNINQNLVSVIIPTYNRSNYLREAVQSVLEQTYRPIECIIIDDGSTDKTLDIVNEFQNEMDSDFQIVYFYQKNSGSQVARNIGTEMARGNFIQYLDSDDLLYPNKLEEQVAYLKSHKECDAVFGDWESGTTDSKNLIKGDSGHDLLEKMLTLEKSLPTSAILLRKEIISTIGSWDVDIRRCQEVDFYMRGLIAGAVYHYQPLLTYLWRYHKGDRIHNLTGVFEFVNFYKKWEDIFTQKQLFTSEIAGKIADWYMWFLNQSKKQDQKKLLIVLEEVIRLKPSIFFYNTYKMRLLRILFGKEIALKIWLKRYLKSMS